MKTNKNILILIVASIVFALVLRFFIRRNIMTLSELTVQYAISQLGVVEVPLGSNKGKDVEKYLKSVGLGGGFPWCMAFVYWCVNEAAKEQGKKNTAISLRSWLWPLG